MKMKIIETDGSAAAVIGREIFPIESAEDLARFAAGDQDGWINGGKMSQDESASDYGDLVAVVAVSDNELQQELSRLQTGQELSLFNNWTAAAIRESQFYKGEL